jgi:hypothetical protein
MMSPDMDAKSLFAPRNLATDMTSVGLVSTAMCVDEVDFQVVLE